MKPLPVPGETPGPEWAQMVNDAIAELQAGGAGTVLVDHGVDPPADTPVGAIIFQKPAPVTTWDFKNLSALPAGWTRRGVASETFDATGMTATYAFGQGHQVALSASIGDAFTLETKLVTGPTSGAMLGAQVGDVSGAGFGVTWYGSPVGCLGIKASAWEYASQFANAGGTPAYPAWFRIRRDGSNWYPSYSFDGTTWSPESSPLSITINPAYVSVGAMLNSGTIKLDYVKLVPGASLGSGRAVGWWDGSAIQPLG